jgi:outer membrane cobalamin receptor
VNTPKEVSMPSVPSSRRHRPFFSTLFCSLLCCVPGLAAAETLSGRVLDPDSRPVAGAHVIIARDGAVIATARTVSAGRFGPLVLLPGEYDITASAPGLRAPRQRISLASAGIEIDLKLALSAIEETVVVSASQVETTLSRVTDSVTVLTRDDLLRRQTETIADALRDVPGMGVVASGGRGALTSLFPRGGESDYTLVLVDGIPQNTFGGGFDAAHMPVANVDRVEVVRGPQSALFGGGAIGSVVHVVTRQAGPVSGDLAVEGGHQQTWRLSGATIGSRQAWRWGAGVEGLRTDGDRREFASIGGAVSNDDYQRLSGSASVGWSDRPTRRARVDVRVDENERGFPGPYGSDPAGTFPGLDTVSRGRNTTYGLGGTAAFTTGAFTNNVQFSYANLRSRFQSPFGESDDETRRVSGRYQADFSVRSIGVSAGWELSHERADNTFITGELSEPVPVRRMLSGWFVEGRPTLGARGVVHAGVRLERIARTSLEGDAFGFRPAFDEDVVWSANPKVSIAWLLRPSTDSGWTKLRAGAGTGIKPPTAFEIAFTDNPGLKPERSRSFDAGIEHAFRQSRLIAEATWFANRYDDLIVTVGASMSGASRYQTDNIANARSRGLETSLRWQASSALTLRGSWTWLDTEVLGVDNAPTETPQPFAVGDPLIRRPRHQAAMEVQWSTRRASTFLSLNGRGAMLDLEPNIGASGGLYDAPGYVTVAVGGSFRLAPGVDVTARVTNLFDRDYEEALGFPALGRSAMVGVRIAGSR